MVDDREYFRSQARKTNPMLLVLHFFNIKSGTDEERMLHLVNHGLTEITKPYGCIERKTWKLLDAEAQGQPVQAAAYIH
jgi:hypothetical protein